MNNAAIQNNGQAGPFEHMDRWRDTIDTNLWGVVNGCHAFTSAMIAQDKPAVIVNTGSKQGITCPPGDTAYNVSKAGVKVQTEALQHKLRGIKGCKVSAFLLVPGWTITMISTRANKRLQGDEFDPTKAEDERSYRGSSTAEAIASLEKRGAWTAQKTVDRMLQVPRGNHEVAMGASLQTFLAACRLCVDFLPRLSARERHFTLSAKITKRRRRWYQTHKTKEIQFEKQKSIQHV